MSCAAKGFPMQPPLETPESSSASAKDSPVNGTSAPVFRQMSDS